jgi:TonB family protein
VDVVGLPELLRNEKKMIPQGKSLDDIQKMLEKAQRQADKIKNIPPPKIKEPPVEKAEKDELVLHPKKTQPEKTPEPAKKVSEAQEKRLKAALDRIKALSKLHSDTDNESEKDEPAPPLKGNKISKGNSLDGDAKESDSANYYDSVRAKLQENWALPPWLSRQSLSAQIEITIDSHGQVRDFHFAKTSGNAQFDTAVKKALQESQPFPTPPEELQGNGILIGFPL